MPKPTKSSQPTKSSRKVNSPTSISTSQTPSSSSSPQVKRLYRKKHDSIFGGVCSGIASYFSIDPVIVRIGWVLATLISMGFGIIAYIVAWIIIPKEK